MISNRKIFLALALCGSLLTNCRPSQNNSNITNAKPAVAANNAWPEIKKENRPWTRWWWMGSAVDEKNINRLLGEYARVGLGGVEIAPIYGAMGHDSRYIEFLSPQWMQMLDFTVKKAGDLGMGVDMTQGTGWPFGGPQVKPAYAASKLIIQKYSLKGGQSLAENISVNDAKQQELGPILQAVMAYGDKGEILNITDKVSAAGKLNWLPKTGNWQI
ncbi:glycosyl hydrolase [Adhaeribacter rhizoryzae]|uniref:glycosyl hydrolase n=1 Tax=Adhaeribacter rhizoryzae TaxID=2607907 RepID=UPI001CC20337|nr:glycosyl hydrolase [Adhaeribacter rhizoryzae]